MWTPRRAAAWLMAGVVAVSTLAVAATPRERSFSSAAFGIDLEAPPGWTLSRHTGYPSILVLFLHPDGCRISVSAAATTAADLAALVDENRKGLESQALRVTRVAPGARSGIEVVSRSAKRAEVVRQAYFMRPFGDGRQATVVTMTCRESEAETRGRAFDVVVKRLRFSDGASQPLAAPADAGPPDA